MFQQPGAAQLHSLKTNKESLYSCLSVELFLSSFPYFKCNPNFNEYGSQGTVIKSEMVREYKGYI